MFLCAGMTGIITSDCIVPYLDASVYTMILNSFFFFETGFGFFHSILQKSVIQHNERRVSTANVTSLIMVSISSNVLFSSIVSRSEPFADS